MDIRIAIFACAALGVVFAISTTALQAASLLCIPVFYTVSGKNRWVLVTAFFAVACYPVIPVTLAYSSSFQSAAAMYLALVFLNTVVLGLATRQTQIPAWVSVPGAVILLSIPPLSQVNPVSFLPLSGWLFPSFGTFGIACLLVLCGIATLKKRIALITTAGLIGLAVPFGSAISIESNSEIVGINLTRPFDERLQEGLFRAAYRFEELERISSEDAGIVILPESVFGQWQPVDALILRTSNKVIYGGARYYKGDTEYVNALINAHTGEVIYEQRSPPPSLFIRKIMASPGRGMIKDIGFKPLICYDLLDPWIMVKTLSRSKAPIVWISNVSWYDGDYLTARMRSVHTAWEYLYRVNIIEAIMKHA